jgi:hypothetical protein
MKIPWQPLFKAKVVIVGLMAMMYWGIGRQPLSAATETAPADSTPNLSSANLHNGGFEQGTEGWAWAPSGAVPASGELDTQEKHSGKQFSHHQ